MASAPPEFKRQATIHVATRTRRYSIAFDNSPAKEGKKRCCKCSDYECVRKTLEFSRQIGFGLWDYILSIRVLALIASSCFSCFVCHRWLDLSFEINLTLVSTAVIFPICFCIAESFKRREKVVEAAASLKTSAVMLYWVYRDWVAPDVSVEYAAHAASVIAFFLTKSAEFLTNPHDDLSRRNTCRDLYGALSSLSVLNEKLAKKAGYTKGGEGGGSRLNQYLRDLTSDFEKLRTVRDYKVPQGLLAFCSVLLNVLPALMGPKYVFEATKNCTSSSGCMGTGYFLAVLLAIVTGGLFRVLTELQDCYDGSGPDDVTLDMARQFLAATKLRPQTPDTSSSSSDMFHFVAQLPKNELDQMVDV